MACALRRRAAASATSVGNRPLVLASDRDLGLHIFDYTGKKPEPDF